MIELVKSLFYGRNAAFLSHFLMKEIKSLFRDDVLKRIIIALITSQQPNAFTSSNGDSNIKSKLNI